jgi:predicted O-methyltransferase YrrM
MISPRLNLDAVRAVTASGLMREREIELLHEFAKAAVGPGVLVEVGSWMGGSALVILAGQHEAGEENVQLYCIDNFEQDTRAAFERNVGPYLESGEVTLLVGDSLDHAAQWPPQRRIKFLFLDGDHRRRHVEREIKLFEPHLLPDAIVLFHDAYYREQPPPRAFQVPFMYLGVAQALKNTIIRDRRYSRFQSVQSLLACRFHPDGAAHHADERERAAFVADYRQATDVNTASLKLSYAAYLATGAARRIVEQLRLERAARAVLRTLGVERLFGIRV